MLATEILSPSAAPSAAPLSETALVERLIAGDDAAFALLISQYHSLLVTVARAIIGEAFADDVVQDSWLAIYQHIANFEGRASLKTWMIKIVSNQAKTRLRREARQVSLEQLDGDNPGSFLEQGNPYLSDHRFKPNGHWQGNIPHWHQEAPEALLEERQLKTCIQKTLAQLPPKQKAAFILRDIEQLGFDEICQHLDISAANVRVLVHRARLALMHVIDRYQETGEC